MAPNKLKLGTFGFPRSAQLACFDPRWLFHTVYMLLMADRSLGQQPAPIDAANRISQPGRCCESQADCQKKLATAVSMQEVWMGESQRKIHVFVSN